MELELNWEQIDYYKRLPDIGLSQEETQEIIVPDASPDIREIVDAGGQLFTTDKSLKNGTLVISGTMDGWVLYYPEGEPKLCRMEVRLPFSAKTEVACSADSRSLVRPVLRKVDARTLNPRKVLVRADIGMDAEVYEPSVLALCGGLTCDDGAGVQKLTGRHTAYVTTQVKEKNFSVYEEVRIPPELHGASDLSSLSARVWCTEHRLVGTKLLFKGEARVQVRHLSQGQMGSVTIPVGFSQVIEMDGAGEQTDSTVDVYVTGLECLKAGSDGQMLNLTLDLLAQATLQENLRLDLLQDAYSTAGDLAVESEPGSLTELMDYSTKTLSVRELLEPDTQATRIVDAELRVCHTGLLRQGEATLAQVQLQAQVLYADGQEQLRSVCRSITVTERLEGAEVGTYRLACTGPGEVLATVTAGGIEVRCDLVLRCVQTRQQPTLMVTHARMTERSRDNTQRHPSAVLRMPQPGERLWDIAKAYHTTMDEICQANALEEANLPTGRMLLIPFGC